MIPKYIFFTGGVVSGLGICQIRATNQEIVGDIPLEQAISERHRKHGIALGLLLRRSHPGLGPYLGETQIGPEGASVIP